MPQDNGFCPMCDWMLGGGWGMMLLVALFWIAVIALVIWAVYRFAHRRRGYRGEISPGHATPEEILDQRYARGDIERDEYLRMREELRPGGEPDA